MNEIIITAKAAHFVAEMLASCGNDRCDLASRLLKEVNKTRPLTDFRSNGGSWLKPVFGNLQSFAIEEGLAEIGLSEVVYYFGGKHHIAHMIRKATQSNLSFLMGADAGLVLDVLLPLEGNYYQNSGYELEFTNFVELSSGDTGTRFIHRGLIVSAEVSSDTVKRIKAEQEQSKEFFKALSRTKTPVRFPKNFLKALEESDNRKGDHA